jgi:hypothetical protein
MTAPSTCLVFVAWDMARVRETIGYVMTGRQTMGCVECRGRSLQRRELRAPEASSREGRGGTSGKLTLGSNLGKAYRSAGQFFQVSIT